MRHAQHRMITRLILIAAVMTAAAATGSAAGTPKVRDLVKSSSGSAVVTHLTVGLTYGASLIDPSPTVMPADRDWVGAQFVSHQAGKVRYENATLFWKDARHELDIISGPAMTTSPADTLARPLSRHFNFAPYDPPTPVRRSTVAGRRALYFDATAPPPGEWTVVGTNPPELRIDHDNSFRMIALTVRAKTVVIVIHAPATDFKQFLPVANRLVSSVRFPAR